MRPDVQVSDLHMRIIEAPQEDNESPSPRPPMKKHVILFLASNPSDIEAEGAAFADSGEVADSRAPDQQARAIQVELALSGLRDAFELETRWAAEPLDLLRELRRLEPAVVHFSGYRGPGVGGDPRPGLFFHAPDGRARFVSATALAEALGAAGASVRLVVLDTCYSDALARALRPCVGCVVGTSGAISNAAARSFAIGFYGGLGEGASIAAAFKHGCAAISLEGRPDSDRPQLLDGVDDPAGLVLAADPQ